MTLSVPAIMAALIFAAGTALPAQTEPRPPKAVPVLEEEEPAVGATPPNNPAAPPKAIPVEEERPPMDEEAPDEPWEDPDTKRERETAEKEKRKADEKRAREEAVAAEKEEVKTVKAVPNDLKPPAPPPPREIKPEKPKIPIQRATDPNAKPLSLLVPAPRGLIVDRNGQPLAQNRMAHYIGIQLPMKEGLTDVQILDFARGPVAFCQNQLPGGWEVNDADIIQHYHKRRWVPMFSPALLPDEKAAKLRDSLLPGVVLRPFFLRTYPENALAGHLLGQMGKSGSFRLPKQDLEAEELMWPPTVGRAGLEKRFDKELTGEPGLYNALFDSKGEMLSEEWTERPRAGHTVVTTLDIEWQRIAERNLKERGVRGAFIIMDVRTGDILTMASTPSTDPNEWVYGVSDDFYQKQLNHPEMPMVCRALAGRYPPASTFKIVTAFAALETDGFGPDSELSCPTGMYFNNIWIKNHSKRHEGMMNVERAIMRSCNTWFFQAAKVCGGAALSTMASRFGFGARTGICLDDMEVAGRMPTPEYYAKKRGTLTGGVLANTSIGQGDVEATPLQVCQMMAAVARGDVLPRPRLVKLVQDVDGRIVQHFPPAMRPLGLQMENVIAVQRGMREVVAGGDGTGSRAENEYVAIAGKTGTGQWHEKTRQYVAWFGGFIPYKEPEYAYVCLYEGDPGEDEISGGRKVAPIVGDVFNEIYKAKKKRGEIKEGSGDDDAGNDTLVTTRREARRATPVEQVRPAPAAQPPPEPPKRGGLRWLFRRRTPPPPPPAPFSQGRPLR